MPAKKPSEEQSKSAAEKKSDAMEKSMQKAPPSSAQQSESLTKTQEEIRGGSNTARAAEEAAKKEYAASGKDEFVTRRSARALGAEEEGDAGPRPEVKGARADRDSHDLPLQSGGPQGAGSRHSSRFGGEGGISTGDRPYPRTSTDTTVAGPAEPMDISSGDREANHGANAENFGRAAAKRHDGGIGQNVNPYGMAALAEDEDGGMHGGHHVSPEVAERYMTARRVNASRPQASPVVGSGASEQVKANLREMQDSILVGRQQPNDWWVQRFDSIAAALDESGEVEEEVEEEDEQGQVVRKPTGRTITKKTAKARQQATVKQAEAQYKKDVKKAEQEVEQAETAMEEAEGRADRAEARKALTAAKESLKAVKAEGKKAIREAEKAAKQ